MASRKEQKEAARQARLEEERRRAEQAARKRRYQTLGGLLIVVVAIIVVVFVVSSSSGSSGLKTGKAATKTDNQVDALLAGIPQSGNTLGKSSAPITITEYGDLECSVCDEFATPTTYTNAEGEPGTGWEDDLIDQYVKTGKAKLVYRSLETASSGNPNSNAFELQQAAANAAGLQGKAWNYIELFYNEQGQEDTGYVTESYLEGLARQIPGLNFSKWMADRNLASVKNQVSSDNAAGSAVDDGSPGTPTIVVKGPAGTKALPAGLPQSYSELETTIASVD